MTVINYKQSIATGFLKVLHAFSHKLTAVILLSAAFLSACNTTNPAPVTNEIQTNYIALERINATCVDQVQAQKAAVNNPTIAQSLALANAAQHCVGDIQYSPTHPDVKTAMQYSALAFVNYVKAGDMSAASETLTTFRATFPQQDLLFADYTSFVDTALVLVKPESITPYQLTSLNINPTLRAEITRQRKWSLR